MKKYVIKLEDDLSAIYDNIAKMNKKSTEESIQIILKRVIETLLKRASDTSE